MVVAADQALAGSRRLGRFWLGLWLLGWVVVVVAAVLWFLLPQVLLSLPTNALGLTVVQLLLAAWAILWLLLTLDTLTGGAGERLYRRLGWTEAGEIPGYSIDATGRPEATTLFYKRLGG